MLKKFEFDLKENELDKLIKILPNSGILVLNGDVGAGKTTLTKKIGRIKFNIDEEKINSPTFSIMQSYDKLHHYDIYNTNLEEILINGLIENFFEDGLHIIEWGDEKLMNYLKKFDFEIYVIKISDLKDKRKYEVFLNA